MSEESAGTLGSRVRRGAAWGALNITLSRVLQFGTTIVVARLVAPEHFGALAVALAVQMIALNASELGATASLARGDRDPDEIAPTVYTIALVTSGLLTGVMWVTAPGVAAAMGDPGAVPVIQVMSLTVLLAGISSVPSAMIWRNFHQDRRMAADLTNIVVTTALVVPLAIAGWEAMALAWSRVGGAAAATVVLVLVAGRFYRPGFDVTVVGGLLRLGGPLAAANIVVFATLNLDYLVVGRRLGATELGLYLLAFNLASLPSNVVTQLVRTIAVPAFGRLHAAGRLAAVVPRAARLVALTTFPMGALLAALAGPLVVVLYGGRWSAAAAALVGLGVFAAARTLTELLADLSLAVGRTGVLFWVQVVWLIALAPALWVAVGRWGIAGAGIAHAVVAWAVVVPLFLVILRRPAGIRLGRFLAALLPAAAAAALGGAAAWGITLVVEQPVLALLAGGVTGVAVFAAVAGRPLVVTFREVRGLSRDGGDDDVSAVADDRAPSPPVAVAGDLSGDTVPLALPVFRDGLTPVRIPPALLLAPPAPRPPVPTPLVSGDARDPGDARGALDNVRVLGRPGSRAPVAPRPRGRHAAAPAADPADSPRRVAR
ncbi:MAG: oligosaccharide flippase family protein [Kineosporiaceae bacterium]